ncbi:hypothetical protein P154DRAFT_42660 [Amniculicola lignicola CBS 123094]|uniref:Uncharacterized protein n=1 Tax=Amniculicola lignicola CBS 123094 TaxID=1392246 RepID=A0A6A5WS62_9PLEO|nr:hypothetical protein P154DRAFT_42660 [Amniculicola lignicola CBS 123094]
MSTRKRRAPGTSPPVQQVSEISNNVYAQNTSNMSPDQYMTNWNDQISSSAAAGMNPTFGDPSLFDGMNYTGNTGGGQSMHNRIVSLDGMEDGSFPGTAPTGASNPGQLVRRNPNQQLAARGASSWEPFNSNAQPEEWENENEDEELEQKALIAKKEAQAKRKQIPPFVQKLSR